MILKKLIVVFLFLLVMGGLVNGVVEAHAGGVMQIASQDAGPFKLTVWTSPDPARTGKVHVATAVASAEDALPVLDAEVFIRLTPQDVEAEALEGQASREDSTNQFLYESIFEVAEDGLYQVTVTVSGTAGEQGEVSFDLAVEPSPPLILGLVALVILAVVTGGAVWFYLRNSSQASVGE